MKNHALFIPLVMLSFSACAGSGNSSRAEADPPQRKPNVIYILADDMGYGDLSCYGQKRFTTPNIDRLAGEGIQFMQHYAGTAVCAPSRSALMTGMTTGYTPIRGNRSTIGQAYLPDSIVTLAEIFKKAGYATGAFGKWGMGSVGSEGDPNNQGFDEFYGYNSQGLAHSYYPDFLIHNQEKVILERNHPDKHVDYAPTLIHNQVMNFIDKNHDKPFFIYYPTIIPHAELVAPEAYMAKFRGKLLPEKSFTKGVKYGAHNYKKGGYENQPEGHAAFAAMITLLDDQVGEILGRLKQYGLDSNTIVIFTSDNGPHLEAGADPEYFNSNGPWRGYKRDLYEGGIREPMLARWPGHIAPGAKTDLISAFWDVVPTMADLLGEQPPKNIQGISFLPTLTGKGIQKEHDYLYWEFHERGGRQAIRKGKWKYVVYNVLNKEKRTAELYDMDTDPEETNDIASKHPDIVKQLQALMDRSRTSTPWFPFIETVQ